MKKYLVYVTVAILSFASCQKEVSVYHGPASNEIRFGTKVSLIETRAFTETGGDLLQTNGFDAAAVIDTDNSVMFNSQVSYDSASGTFGVAGQHYYFPEGGTMSFYGVYPSSENIVISDGGEATVSYAQNADEDLVVAKLTGISKEPDAVVMNFEHILSQVTATVRTDDANVNCKLYSITVTDAAGGIYSFTDDSWTLDGTTSNYSFFSSTDGMTITTTASPVGSPMSFMPGKISINVKWKCYNKVGGQLVCDNDQTITTELTKGKQSILNFILPANSSGISFSLSVAQWTPDEKNLELVTVYTPELVSALFTVDDNRNENPDDDIKVKFTKGNLFWNGSEYRCEKNQYDSPSAWDTDHVGHLLWTSDATKAYGGAYTDASRAITDKFFATDGGLFDGFTILSTSQWSYLFSHALAKNSSNNYEFYIDGKKCAILKPDGFDGTIANKYSAEEWTAAEETYGLVALPLAGYRYNMQMNKAGEGWYWTSSTYPNDVADARHAYIFGSTANANANNSRNNGHLVRLVQVQGLL